jgi:cold shock CspA family protein
MNVSRRGLFSMLAGGSASAAGAWAAGMNLNAALVQHPLREGWTRATVQSFDKVQGFGFLTPELGRERIFVHICGVRASGLSDLTTGQVVDVKVKRMKSPYQTEYRALRIECV